MTSRACPVCHTVFHDDGGAVCPACGTPIDAPDEPTREFVPAEETLPWLEERDHGTIALPVQPDIVDTLISRETERIPISDPDLEPWYRRNVVVAIAAAVSVLILILIFAATRGGQPETNLTIVSPQATVAQAVPTLAPATVMPSATPGPSVSPGSSAVVTAPTPVPGTSGSATPHWTTVMTLSGTDADESDPFTLTGAQARLRYTLQGSNTSTLTIYVVQEGKTPGQNGEQPDVDQSGQTEDEIGIRKPAGQYYLDIDSTDGTWSITIEELR